MNPAVYRIAPLLVLTLALSGCDLVEGIFKAGVWVGVLAVLGVIAIVVWIIAKVVS